MKVLFDIFINIIPTIITGICTFFVTKYTYNKNKPLEKLEVSYNRIYYPLYRLINEKDNNIDIIIEKTKIYIKKYDKYVDRSTLRAFNSLCQCKKNGKREVAYQNFKNNIYNRSLYLRRSLGYLEPSFWQIYTYSSKEEKSTFRILMEISCLYICLAIGTMAQEVRYFFVICSIILFIVLILEIICKFISFLYYKIRK